MKRPFLSSLVTLLMCGAHSQLLSPEQIQKNLAARERSIRNLSATLETGREFEVDKSVKGKLKERKTSLPIETFFYDQGTFLSKAEYDSNINSYKFRAVEEK